jgi:hypothetical protein
MPGNYILLERVELNDSAASVTFANIPQTGYTDLKIVISGRTTDSTNIQETITYVYNGSSTSRSYIYLIGSGSSVATGGAAANAVIWGLNGNITTANTFSNSEIYIPNYTSSNHKSSYVDGAIENNASTAGLGLTANLWANTAAITSITFTPALGSFTANSTFSLYGIAAVGTSPAIAPRAAGGNVIDTDGTYWIHTFNTSGTFTPLVPLTCDYLVVAGGGGGGGGIGGGGGAGGLRSTITATGGGGSLETALSLAATSYPVTVGAGGTGGNNTVKGVSGSNSVFSTITSTGGGGGGAGQSGDTQMNGLTGGSGGGQAAYSTAGQNNAAGTANQGYQGGSAASGGNGGGGGGAGAVGANATTTIAGNGGAGVATSITGSSVTYAGGGAGGAYTGETAGTGGSGGGGNATNSDTVGTAGTANRGAGGGGGGYQSSGALGGAGGSGVVIIRYPV